VKRVRSSKGRSVETRRIIVLGAPGSQILDVAGPVQIFVRAAEIYARHYPDAKPLYAVEAVSTTGNGAIGTTSGITLSALKPMERVRGRIDTLLIAGGEAMESDRTSAATVKWVRERARDVRRIGSICTGAMLLARAGLLEGRKATTHWKWCELLHRRYPKVTVDPDPIFVRDGNVYTSAGVTAGMDLALALVEEDIGAPLALEVARELVLYLRRPGGQAQFSAALAMQTTDRKPLRELETWVLENLRQTLDARTLAARMSMSPRNLSRVFKRELKLTPHRFVERLRIEVARRRLTESQLSFKRIAFECGFSGAGALRSVFRRVLNTTPGAYRERFASAEHHSLPRGPHLSRQA
jgi:transcriptional regulator GlxA family with amidase domain